MKSLIIPIKRFLSEGSISQPAPASLCKRTILLRKWTKGKMHWHKATPYLMWINVIYQSFSTSVMSGLGEPVSILLKEFLLTHSRKSVAQW